VPRIAEVREPAEPASAGQQRRRQSILRAAARLGREQQLERVQMADVAKEAGVAIATLYRYFPSKVHLFAGVLRERLLRLDASVEAAPEAVDPVTAVGDLLIDNMRGMLAEPVLALSMLTANNVAQTQVSGESRFIDRRFEQLLLRVAHIEDPTPDERRRGRLLMQCWFGVLMSALNGRSTAEEAEQDIRRACELLLG
jgi:AcrR family transcriptional regulator